MGDLKDADRVCPFCTLSPARVIDSNDHGLVIRDRFPISPGHTLILSRRHVGSVFDLSENETRGLLGLLAVAKARVAAELTPDGYNIGINDGSAAGQTVAHLHIHLIPRYVGDHADPRGGVRWIVPEKANYWDPR